jgi:ATP-dependent RNA helicase RhlE
MHRIGRSGRAGEVGLALSLIDYEDYEDYHHFKIIEKKNNVRLEHEEVAGFEIDETLIDVSSAIDKSMVPFEDRGINKRKNKSSVNTDIWSGYSESE